MHTQHKAPSTKTHISPYKERNNYESEYWMDCIGCMVREYDVSFFSDANKNSNDDDDDDNERTNELMMLTIVRYCYNVYSCAVCKVTLFDFKSVSMKR